MDQLLTLQIFYTKNVLPLYILVCHMTGFSERPGELELGLRPCFLKPFVSLFHFFGSNLLFTERHG